MGIDGSTPLPRSITILIKSKARQMAVRHGFLDADRDDLEQQIVLEVIRRRSRFDRTKATESTFLSRLVRHAAADIIATRNAAGRDYKREDGSLDHWVHDDAGQWGCRADSVAEDDIDHRVGQPGMSREDIRDLRIDVAKAVAAMPQRLRTICTLLLDGRSVQEIAVSIGMHRSSIYPALDEIREHFTAAGLEEYSRPSKVF